MSGTAATCSHGTRSSSRRSAGWSGPSRTHTGRRFGDHLQVAAQGVAFLLGRFRDWEHGGFFWKTDLGGHVRDDRKILYGQVFALYALVEYSRASNDPGALDEARSLFSLLLERAHDARHGGWLEHFGRNWRWTRRRRRGVEVEVPGLKSANTHLHALEALTELYRETGDQTVRAALAETVDLSKAHFYPEDPRASRLHRTRNWSLAGRPGISHGHNVEFAWLLLGAERALGRSPSRGRFDAYLDAALGAHETAPVWWVEAERLAALTCAVVPRAEDRYAEALEAQIAFLFAHQIDPADGIWLNTVAADGRPLNPEKIGTCGRTPITTFVRASSSSRRSPRAGVAGRATS